MTRLTGSIRQYPARTAMFWYLGLILLGTFLLTLPCCRQADRDPVTWLDALFTSASATCVTGLVVRSTPHDFSLPGQIVILCLIQLGGIGIMTVTTFLTFRWRDRRSMRTKAVIAESLGSEYSADLRWVLQNVIGMTLLFEGIGFVILFARNLFYMTPGLAAWRALFHSVSAFCNAGFALHDNSLIPYQNDYVVNLAICGLIIAGGLGFPVMIDLRNARKFPLGERWRRLHLNSKLMLIGTPGLILAGWLSVLVLEWNHILSDRSFGQKLLASFFQSVTARTAGFNTLELSSLTNATLFVVILLMVIGAGPCSTAGGFKVSTLMTMMARGWATVRGYDRITLFGRTIPEVSVDRASMTALMFSVVSIVGLTLLLAIEQSNAPHPSSQGAFLDAMFEIVSALATVGLSTGMTPELSAPGRIIIIVLMFVGRLGPISIVVALSRSKQSQPIEMPTEEPLIG